MSNQDLVPLFIPALCAILINAEDKKCSPLSSDEVLKIRGGASVIMVTKEHQKEMAESRGYSDIDPENCWYDWQILRREMNRKPDIDPGAKFSQIDRNDEDYKQTIISAKDTLGHFRTMILERSEDRLFPLIKILLSEPDYRAYMWLLVISDNTSGFTGEIFELPSEFKQFAIGQKINVQDSDVQDWMINDEGTLHGGYSLRYNRSKMDADEQYAFDKHIGVDIYAHNK